MVNTIDVVIASEHEALYEREFAEEVFDWIECDTQLVIDEAHKPIDAFAHNENVKKEEQLDDPVSLPCLHDVCNSIGTGCTTSPTEKAYEGEDEGDSLLADLANAESVLLSSSTLVSSLSNIRPPQGKTVPVSYYYARAAVSSSSDEDDCEHGVVRNSFNDSDGYQADQEEDAMIVDEDAAQDENNDSEMKGSPQPEQDSSTQQTVLQSQHKGKFQNNFDLSTSSPLSVSFLGKTLPCGGPKQKPTVTRASRTSSRRKYKYGA